MNELYIKNNIQKKYLNKSRIKTLSKKFNKVLKKTFLNIKDENKTLNILNQNFKLNLRVSDLKRFKRYESVAIIGMGGSILGSEAIYNFFGDKMKKKFYFFNDLNIKKNIFFKKKKKLNKILFVIISKSGSTLETLSNFLSLNILKRNSKNIIIISEKKNNPLYLIAKKFNFFYIEHKENIGGRFSVLSEVGMIPAHLMGLNISKLRSNTIKYLKRDKNFFLKDSTVKLANLMISKKIKNIIFLNYAPELEKFLFWCQQLLAESLGKDNKGFLPMISSAPKDHHSLLQLYLEGPKDKLFCIFSSNLRSKEKIALTKNLTKVNHLQNKKLTVIKKAQKNALIKTLKNKNIPFREFEVKLFNENTIGELFSYFIIETVIVAGLTNINPYDQPSVEQVKNLTKKLLS